MHYTLIEIFQKLKNKYFKWVVYLFIILSLAAPFIYLNSYEQPVHSEIILDKMKIVNSKGKIVFNFIMEKEGVLVVSSSTYYKYDISQNYVFKKQSESKLAQVLNYYLILVLVVILALFLSDCFVVKTQSN